MHRLTDFKNFRHAEVDLSAPLTILLGRNGSGKTNLIEGIEVLGALARGTPFTDITELGRRGAVEVRGGLPSCQRFGAKSFGLHLNLPDIRPRRRRSRVSYTLDIVAESSGIHLLRESLMLGQKSLILTSPAEDGLLNVVYDNFSPGPNPSNKKLSGSVSVLSRYSELIADTRVNHKRREASEAAAAVLAQLPRPYVFDLIPNEMRNYERKDAQAQLTRSGSNLSSVLFSLKNGDAERGAALHRITKTIRQIPEEPFQEIGFAETPLGDVMAGFVTESGSVSNGTPSIDARLLSDGTLRMLAVLSAMETVPSRSRVVIEEFDNGLHPSRAEVVISYLAEAASRRHLNVVLTTHSPAVMNTIEESRFPCVWICHRDDTRQESSVTRLSSLDDALLMSITGGLGNFVTRGRLDRRLDSGYEEYRDRATLEWLDSLS